MSKKKTKEQPTGKMLGLRVNQVIWDEFEALRREIIPRTSATGLLEAAMMEYIQRHKQTKKEGKQ